MRLEDLKPEYRVAFRHNPDHFYRNSFHIEIEGTRLVLVGVVKRHIGKRFRIVGFLKPARRK